MDLVLCSLLKVFAFPVWVFKARTVTRRTKLVAGLEHRSCEGQLRLWGCLVGRRGGWRATPSVRTVLSCARGGIDWILGSISVPRGWADIGTGFLEGCSLPQASQSAKGICAMPFKTFCRLGLARQWHRRSSWNSQFHSDLWGCLLLDFSFNTIHKPGKVWQWVLHQLCEVSWFIIWLPSTQNIFFITDSRNSPVSNTSTKQITQSKRAELLVRKTFCVSAPSLAFI